MYVCSRIECLINKQNSLGRKKNDRASLHHCICAVRYFRPTTCAFNRTIRPRIKIRKLIVFLTLLIPILIFFFNNHDKKYFRLRVGNIIHWPYHTSEQKNVQHTQRFECLVSTVYKMAHEQLKQSQRL